MMPVVLSVLTVMVAAGCASKAGTSDSDKAPAMSDSSKMQGMTAIKLDGSHEVPPVNTTATGNGTITVSADKSVRGSIMTTGIEAMAAHIHQGAAGANGPVIIPLTKGADNSFAVPTGAVLTDAQYDSYMAGNLYVNVHSAANPNGEIRAQLNPK
ncbi:CHRD domain-containing protein [Undibacterium arcticum]